MLFEVDSPPETTASLQTKLDGTYVPVAGTYAATTTDVLTAKVTGDAANRYVLNANGLQEWGNGADASDANWGRIGQYLVGTTIDGVFQSGNGGQVKIGGVGPFGVSGLTFTTDTNVYRSAAATLKTDGKFIVALEIELDGDLNHDGTNVGFYGTAPVAQQTGVAVSAAGIHAALVNLGLITA